MDATGFSGAAWLYGGAGNATLLAGPGNDYLDGGTGKDCLVGGAGPDILVGINGLGDTLIAGTGDTTIYGSPYADVIQGGPGNELIYGGGGNDLINGGSGNDTIVGGSGAATIYGGTGSDMIFDGGAGTLYAEGQSGGSANSVDTIYGSGQDTIFGGLGNDIIYNQGGTNTITGGGTGTQVYTVAQGTVSLPTPGTIPTPPNWPPTAANSAATLPTGVDEQGRWTALEGSASGGGLSNSPAQAVESSIVTGASGQYVAWSDSRDGQYEIYVAEHTAGGWQQLAGSAQGGGISDTAGAARRPSIALDAAGQPVVAYTVFNGTSSDIDVAEYNPSANNGQGGWMALGTSQQAGGISGTGMADDAVIVETANGPVVAWLDSSGGVANIFVKQFVNGAWVALGTGAASGSGLSASASAVSGLAMTTNGTNVAVAWTQTVNSVQQIYVLQNSGGAWSQLAGSASGNGVSNSRGNSTAPTLAYDNGTLFVAWLGVTSGQNQIYAVMFSGGAWQAAGTGADSGLGISASRGPAAQPVLSANDGQIYLAWIDNEFPSDPSNGGTVYVKSWNGSAFVEQVPGDASFNGILNGLGIVQAVALSVDPAGHPYVSWTNGNGGNSQIDVLANTFNLGTIHYVNDGSTQGDIITTAAGNDANNGLSPSTPKLTLQGVFSDAAHPLHAGDVIFVDNGVYPGAVNLSSVPPGVLILGSPTGVTTLSATVTGTNASGITLENLTLSAGVSLTGGTQIALENDYVSGSGIALSGGTGVQVFNDYVSSFGAAITLGGAAGGVIVDYDTIASLTEDLSVSGGGATGLDFRDNQLSSAAIGIALASAAGGTISGNTISAATTGISITAAFTGIIAANSIFGAATGVSYQASAELSGNDIHDNTAGVVSTVASTATGFGFVGNGLPNQIFDNATGVQLTGAMQDQHIFDNTTGISGSGSLGGTGLNEANLIEANGVGIDFNGPIEFNEITRETVGIQAQSGQLIAYNLIYRNTQAGIVVNGQTRREHRQQHHVRTRRRQRGHHRRLVRGRAAEQHLLGRSRVTTSTWPTTARPASSVITTTCMPSGTGKLVHWDIDFTDILDWQDDVAQFDLHSEGTTAVNPTLDQPRFAGLAINDLPGDRPLRRHAQQQSDHQCRRSPHRRSSAGCLPKPAHQSRLLNPVSPAGRHRPAAAPRARTRRRGHGTSYFFAGPNAVVTLDQTVSLTASGIPTPRSTQAPRPCLRRPCSLGQRTIAAMPARSA